MPTRHPPSSYRRRKDRKPRDAAPKSVSDRLRVVDALDAVLGIQRVTAPPTVVSVNRVGQPVTIERTSKEYKAGMVVGRLFTYAGVAMFVYSLYVFQRNFGRMPNTVHELLVDQPSVYVSMTGVAGGFVLYRLERFLAWWNNG